MRPADVEELTEGEPKRVARENARRKAAAVEGALVLGVDTIVALDGVLFGKPPGEDAARATLHALAGRTHAVVSGVALARAGRIDVATAITHVTFRPRDDALLAWYLTSGEWRERAGGYAIQGRGAALVAGIGGDYTNVVGLPLPTLLDLAPELVTR